MKRIAQGFPGGSAVKNVPANGGERFDPWSRKIPHAREQLNLCPGVRQPPLLCPCTATTEARTPTARTLQQEKPLQ